MSVPKKVTELQIKQAEQVVKDLQKKYGFKRPLHVTLIKLWGMSAEGLEQYKDETVDMLEYILDSYKTKGSGARIKAELDFYKWQKENGYYVTQQFIDVYSGAAAEYTGD